MARRRVPPNQRSLEIVRAAQWLFATKGVEATTVNDIVKAVGLAQGTFYLYFASKEEVLNTVVRDLAEGACEVIIRLSQSSEFNARQKFMRVWGFFFDLVAKEGEALKHFHDDRNKKFHDQLVEEVIRRLTPVLGGIVKQGVAEGFFTTAYPQEAAAFVLAAVQVVYSTSFFRGEGPSDQQVKALWDFIWSGLHGEGPPPVLLSSGTR